MEAGTRQARGDTRCGISKISHLASRIPNFGSRYSRTPRASHGTVRDCSPIYNGSGYRCVIFATGLHDGAGLQKAGDAAS